MIRFSDFRSRVQIKLALTVLIFTVLWSATAFAQPTNEVALVANLGGGFGAGIFAVNPTSGHRAVISNFGNPAQGPLGAIPFSIASEDLENILVLDSGAGSHGVGRLFRVNLVTGNRTSISDLSNPAQGPVPTFIRGVVLEDSGNALILDDRNFDQGGSLFRVDLATGNRTIVSDSLNPAQGPRMIGTASVILEDPGNALVTSRRVNFAGTDTIGSLFRVDLTTGDRTIISDFSNPSQGTVGTRPNGLILFGLENALVADEGLRLPAALFNVDLTTGDRTRITNLDNPGQGPEGLSATDVSLLSSGNALLLDEGAINFGFNPLLFKVDTSTGGRTIVSDFGNPAQGPLGNRPASIITSILPQPDLSVIMSAFPDPVIAGDSLAYSIFVVNNRGFSLDTTLTDTLPSDVIFVSAVPDQGSCSERTGVVTCNLDGIASGGTVEVVITVTAPNTPGAILNTVEVSSLTEDANPGDNSAQVITDVVPVPPHKTESDLAVRKTSPNPVIINEDFDYTVVVANLGPDDASNVTLIDILPTSVDIVLPLPEGCTETAPMSGTVECAIGTLPVGEVAEFNITVNPMSLGFIINLAQATVGESPLEGTVQTGPVPPNNTDSLTTEVISPPPLVTFSDLFVVKTDTPDPVVVGEELTYDIFIYNFGPDLAQDVILTDILPEMGVDLTMVTAPNCVQGNNQLVCELGDIEVGEVAIIPITVIPTEVGFILNTAQALLTSELPDGTFQSDIAPGNNTDSEVTTIVAIPPPIANLFVQNTDHPDPANEGQKLEYTLFATNYGPDEASGVILTDTLPLEGLNLDTVTIEVDPPEADMCVQAGADNNIVTCEFPMLVVGESITVQINAQVSLPTPGEEFLTVFSVAEINSSIAEDPYTFNNVSVESTLLGRISPSVPIANLGIVMTDSPDPVQVNGLLKYVIFVNNTGPDPATGVVVKDVLPSSVKVVTVDTDQGSCTGPAMNVLTCELGNLGVGETTKINIVVKPTEIRTIVNVPQVSGNEYDPVLGNNSSPQATSVEFRVRESIEETADLFIANFSSPNFAVQGRDLNYTVQVGNLGPQDADGVTLTSILPADGSFVSANSSQGMCSESGGIVTCNLGTLPNTEDDKLAEINIVVIPESAGPIVHTVSVEASQEDPSSFNNNAVTIVRAVTTTNSSNCSSSLVGTPKVGDTAFNLGLLLLPLLIIGVRAVRRRN